MPAARNIFTLAAASMLASMPARSLADFYVVDGTQFTEGTIVGGPPFTTTYNFGGIYPVQADFDALKISDFNGNPAGPVGDVPTAGQDEFSINVSDGYCGIFGADIVFTNNGDDTYNVTVPSQQSDVVGTCVSDTSQLSESPSGCCPQSTIWGSLYRCSSIICTPDTCVTPDCTEPN